MKCKFLCKEKQNLCIWRTDFPIEMQSVPNGFVYVPRAGSWRPGSGKWRINRWTDTLWREKQTIPSSESIELKRKWKLWIWEQERRDRADHGSVYLVLNVQGVESCSTKWWGAQEIFWPSSMQQTVWISVSASVHFCQQRSEKAVSECWRVPEKEISFAVRSGSGQSSWNCERNRFTILCQERIRLSLERILSGSNPEWFILLKECQASAERIQNRKISYTMMVLWKE